MNKPIHLTLTPLAIETLKQLEVITFTNKSTITSSLIEEFAVEWLRIYQANLKEAINENHHNPNPPSQT